MRGGAPCAGVVVSLVVAGASGCSSELDAALEPMHREGAAPTAADDDVSLAVDASSVADAGRDETPLVDAAPPGTHADAIQNLDETDVDCGGATGAARCAVGRMCKIHDDCGSKSCRYDGICVAARSCTAHHGGDTCGPDGTDDCCRAIAVPRPGAPYALDKYSITAGRFRQFVERTSGDLRGFIQANRPTWWDPLWDAWLPVVLDDGTYDGRDGVYQQLGPHLYYEGTGGNLGCFVEGVGARTYWIPPTVNQARFQDSQAYDQATLDEKPLQCATYFMFAAFCAWDGGHVASLDEIDYAWNKGEPENF